MPRRDHAREQAPQELLAVAGHAGDADNFAARYLERQVRDASAAVLGGEPRATSRGGPPATDVRRATGAGASPDHPAHDAPLVVDVAVSPARRPARMTATRSAQAVTSSSLWVMRTTAHPPRAQGADLTPQALGLGPGQHRRRLVEDHGARAEVQHLGDLDELLLPHRQARGRRARIDLGRDLGQPPHDLAPRARPRRQPARSARPRQQRFSATERAGTRLNCWNTMPMPAARAARGPSMRAGRPSISIVPASGA